MQVSAPDSSLSLQDFDFPVPDELVAQEPLEERDASRLLVKTRTGSLKHAAIKNLTTELPAGTLLIFNDTRVIAGRMFGQLPTGGRIELFLLSQVGEPGSQRWKALGRPMRKMHVGTRISMDMQGEVYAEILAKETADDGSAFVEVSFHSKKPEFNLEDWLDEHGYIPLPPYIRREQPRAAPDSADRLRYQTVYAKERGSVAAPTAGLHFSDNLLKSLNDAGIEIATVCLHVGAGTFLPVKSNDITKHRMHSERYLVPPATLMAIEKAKHEGRPIVAVGTTSLRSLESLEREAKRQNVARASLAGTWLATELFVFPKNRQDRYQPWAATGLITNFHQPCSTLFMLISALIGLDQAKAMYAEAVKEKYRFFSYGDASLLWF